MTTRYICCIDYGLWLAHSHRGAEGTEAGTLPIRSVRFLWQFGKACAIHQNTLENWVWQGTPVIPVSGG